MDVCVNCATTAHHYVADPGVNPLFYCNICLPKHLQQRAEAGHFSLPVAPKPEVVEEKPAPKKKKPVVEEVVEEPVEAPVESEPQAE